MAVRPTSLRIVAAPASGVSPSAAPRGLAATAATVRVAPVRAAAASGAYPDLQSWQNAVVKAIATAQLAQAAIEAAGHAFNDGTGTKAGFEAAQADYKAATDALKALYVAGRPFNTGFFHFGGFKLDKYFKASGAQALIDYRPPTLGEPAPVTPGRDTFHIKLDAAKKAAEDAVSPEPALTALLKEAGTRAQIDELLKAGRKGHRSYQDSPYWTACSANFFRAAYARIEAIEKPATLDAKLALYRAAADDAVNMEPELTRALAVATSEAEVARVVEVARKGYRSFLNSSYTTEYSGAFYAAAHERLAAIAGPSSLASKLEMLEDEADDAVKIEDALTKLLAEAKTPADIDAMLKLGRKGSRISQGSSYRTECSQAFFRAAYDRLGVLTQPATVDAKLALIKRAADDAVNVDTDLVKLLPEARTRADIDRLLDVGRHGHAIAIGSGYRTESGQGFFQAAYARLTAIVKPTTVDAQLELLKDGAKDTVNPEPALTRLLASATTEAEVNKLLDFGRKGYHSYLGASYPTDLSSAFFAAGHTRLLQLALQATVAPVVAADRVKFALQPLPAFGSRDGYRNYAVKAAAYALVDIQDVAEARKAFAAGAITERQLKNAEDGLELSLKLVEALQKAVGAGTAAQWRAEGFDVAAFWSQYAIADTAKAALG